MSYRLSVTSIYIPPDNPHKCLILNFRNLGIFAQFFRTSTQPGFFSSVERAFATSWRPTPPTTCQKKKIPLGQGVLSKNRPDLHVLANLLSEPESDFHQPKLLNRPFCPSGLQTKKFQTCPILPQKFMGIIRGPLSTHCLSDNRHHKTSFPQGRRDGSTGVRL